MKKMFFLLITLTMLAGCQRILKPAPASNESETTTEKPNQDVALTEDQLTTLAFNIEGTTFKLDMPAYFTEEPDDLYALYLVGQRGDIYIEGARKIDLDGIQAFKDVYLEYYLDSYEETIRKDSLKTEKMTIGGYDTEKTSIEMVEDGFVFQYEGYVVETDDVYLLINVSGKKSFFSKDVDYLQLLNSLKVDKITTATGKKI